jgi:ubiquinone/menaquinone biosynthesis C-methylase UbiE
METVRTKKAYKGLPMEGPIAKWYAKITRQDLNRHQWMARQLVGKIPAGGSVLEIAPGPGFFCIELAKLGNYKITGLDISKSFVEIAQKNAAAEKPKEPAVMLLPDAKVWTYRNNEYCVTASWGTRRMGPASCQAQG